MFDLSGKSALVTGATGGLGASIARSLHGQGAHVVISGTREGALADLARELGERVTPLPCNLSDGAAVDQLIPKTLEILDREGLPLSIVVNNAGVTRDGLAVRMKDEDWDTVLNINLKAAFVLTRGALKVMMRQRWGRIINITSVVAVTGNPGQANYCAAKAGLIGMTKSMAQEVASRGITINCVAPGFIKSPMTDALNDKQREAILAAIPSHLMGVGEDIAAACVYLASDEAGYVTGQTLHVNGGMTMV